MQSVLRHPKSHNNKDELNSKAETFHTSCQVQEQNCLIWNSEKSTKVQESENKCPKINVRFFINYVS